MTTKAILEAPLQTVEGYKGDDNLQELAEQYMQALFPYHQADSDRTVDMLQEQLKRWVDGTSSLEVTALPSISDQMRQARRLRRGRVQREIVDRRLSHKMERKLE